jgi:pre-mRNA-splicing factor SYF2
MMWLKKYCSIDYLKGELSYVYIRCFTDVKARGFSSAYRQAGLLRRVSTDILSYSSTLLIVKHIEFSFRQHQTILRLLWENITLQFFLTGPHYHGFKMSLPQKRKITPPRSNESTGTLPNTSNSTKKPSQGDLTTDVNDSHQPGTSTPLSTASTTTTTADRAARFAALKSRATASARSNLAEAKAEASRAAIDPKLLSNLSRKSAIASHNLLKANTEDEDGTGSFERKRAWDYTIEESERWDERMERKKAARENNVFQDYSAEAGKIYDRQMREMEKSELKDGGKNREEYERQKAELIEAAARSGGLEIVEMENGELVAIDNNGTFYSSTESTGFVENRPKKENVDRLVNDLRKAEEVRLKKRRERGRGDDEGDVTYINDKNKQFNLKLARFYDRYTRDIRESFERGTAI